MARSWRVRPTVARGLAAACLVGTVAGTTLGGWTAGPAAAAATTTSPAGSTVLAFGDAPVVGGPTPGSLAAPIAGITATPGRQGYWLTGADGGVFTYGGAPFYDAALGRAPTVGLAPTPDGHGYWVATATGGITSVGDAPALGAPATLDAPVVGIAATRTGDGYWLVGADGGVFSFGDAPFGGSLGATHLDAPIVGIAATPDGRGYWLVGADGGVFSFGDAPYEGSGVGRLGAPGVVATGIAADGSGGGYWIATSADPVVDPSPLPSVEVSGYGCDPPETAIEPSGLTLGCMPPTSVTGLRWSAWTPTAASGTGTLEYDDCVPDCADGRQEQAPVTVTLRYPVQTSAGRQFSIATVSNPYLPSPLDLPLAPG